MSPSPFDEKRRRLVITFHNGELAQPFETAEQLEHYIRALAPMILDATWRCEQ